MRAANVVVKKKNVEIETLRGIACLLLVSYHVVGDTPSSGLKLDTGLLRELNDLLIYARMPLFTFISGFVYAMRPFDGGVKQYVQGKSRRLLIPLLVVGTAFAIIQSVTPQSNTSVENWYLLHIIPYAHFWFIEAIFVIFMLLIPLESFGFLKEKHVFLVVFLLACLLYLSNVGTPYFGISGAIYLLPYFLVGVFCYRFSFSLVYSRWYLLGALLSLIGIIVVAKHVFGYAPEKRSLMGLLIGLASCLVLLSLRPRNDLLASIGFFSYTIYLYHVFFTAGSRIALSLLDVHQTLLLFLAGTCCGIVGPIIVDKLFSANKYLRLPLLGK